MLKKGITNMVRIGGGSKSSNLDPYQLRNREASGFNQVQNRQYARLMGALEDSEKAIHNLERGLNRSPSKRELLSWLEEDPEAFEELQLPESLQSEDNTIIGIKVRVYVAYTANLILDM